MAGFSVGDSVRFKSGVEDYDFGVEIGGWQGRVIEVDDDIVTVAFDSVTLRAMPTDFIERCEEDGLDWGEYVAAADELEAASPRDTEDDAETAISELKTRYAYSYLGEEGKELNRILGGIDPDDGYALFDRWSEYLPGALTLPFEARVDEPLTARGPVQYGDKLRVMGINAADDLYGVLVDVKKGRKSYVIPLCELSAVDEQSPNHDLLQLYRVWFANR